MRVRQRMGREFVDERIERIKGWVRELRRRESKARGEEPASRRLYGYMGNTCSTAREAGGTCPSTPAPRRYRRPLGIMVRFGVQRSSHLARRYALLRIMVRPLGLTLRPLNTKEEPLRKMIRLLDIMLRFFEHDSPVLAYDGTAL